MDRCRCRGRAESRRACRGSCVQRFQGRCRFRAGLSARIALDLQALMFSPDLGRTRNGGADGTRIRGRRLRDRSCAERSHPPMKVHTLHTYFVYLSTVSSDGRAHDNRGYERVTLQCPPSTVRTCLYSSSSSWRSHSTRPSSWMWYWRRERVLSTQPCPLVVGAPTCCDSPNR